MEGFHQEKEDYSKYEISFCRWLVSEIDSVRMSISEAREAFNPHYSQEIVMKSQRSNRNGEHRDFLVKEL